MVLQIISLSMAAIMISKEADVMLSSGPSDEAFRFEYMPEKLSTVDLVVAVVNILLCGILLFGVHKKKPVYILPSLGFKLIFLIAYVIVGTFYYTSNVARMGKYASVFVATFLIDVGVEIFFWIVFYSYYRQLADEKAPAALHGVVSYTHKTQNEEATVQNSVYPTEVDSALNNVMQKTVL